MKIISFLLLITGLILLIYMILIEDEPGAVPLLMILAGTSVFLLQKYRRATHDS